MAKLVPGITQGVIVVIDLACLALGDDQLELSVSRIGLVMAQRQRIIDADIGRDPAHLGEVGILVTVSLHPGVSNAS